MREVIRLVEAVLQGASPRGVITQALNEYGGERGDHDGEHVRVTVIDHPGNRIIITEFPGKPVKRKVRVYDMDTSWQVQAYHHGGSAYLSSNVFRDMQFHNSMTYEQAKAALDKAVEKANGYAQADNPGAQVHFPTGHESTINFQEVEPKDYKPMDIKGKDFVLQAKWDSFTAYSPSSDFQQADPTYSVWSSKSSQGARTVFKALSWDPTALRNIPWSKFGDWCREAGVGIEMSHSVWR
jgi:hypothetical protein